jgi:acetylornithine deacetylase
MPSPVELLTRLVAVDTHNPGGDETALCHLLADELRARGGAVRVIGEGAHAYAFATWGKPRLLLNAHVDTVPVNAGWSGDPFSPRVADGRVIGLGACDTKGAIAAILCALDAQPPRDVAVAFTGDEERHGTMIRALLERERDSLRAVERAIVCEPTSCRAGTRHRGILWIEATIGGRGGHSSRADDEPAPLYDAARLATAFYQWGQQQRELGPIGFRGQCMNIAKLDGGVAFNVIPDEATLTISVRPPPGTDVDAVRDQLFALARDVAPRVQLAVPMSNPSFHTREPAKFPPAIGAAQPIDLAFWTEAALLSAAGIDCVVFGPGDIAHAHAPDEFVPIADLERARATFAAVIAAEAQR